jgi:hypothetical protein
MTNHCGSCTACCRVFSIPELKKPAGQWCQHCTIGKECRVYESRPQMCRDFECLWLQSQSQDDRVKFPPELRPDKCKVVFSPSTNPNIMVATTMPGAPLAWRAPLVANLIDRLVKAGAAVVIGPPASTVKTFVSFDGIQESRMTEPDENGMQWNIPPVDGKQRNK